MNAIGYVRVSTKYQAKEGVSLDNQRSKIEAYCQLKDLDLAEMERRIIGERTKAALAHKRAKRESIGGYAPPYGYDLDDTNHLVRNDLEQKGIKLIRSLHEKGNSLRVICRELEANGYRKRHAMTDLHS